MIIGRITRVDGIRVAATFYTRLQPFILKQGKPISSPRINSFVKTGIGLDAVICQITGEHEAEYDTKKEVAKTITAAATGPFVVDLEVRGYISNGDFKGGLRSLPIVGAAVETVSEQDMQLLYSSMSDRPLTIGRSLFDESQPVLLDTNRLMASHVGVFGNTGSGKSNTLAKLIRTYMDCLPPETNAAKILVFDLNNEYGGDAIVSEDKKTIYHLNTQISKEANSRKDEQDKLVPLDFDLLDEDNWGTILRATQKTQMPIIRRAYNKWKNNDLNEFISELKQSLVDKREALFFTLRNYCSDLIHGIAELSYNSTTHGFYYSPDKYISKITDIKQIRFRDNLNTLDTFFLWLSMEVAKTSESGINFEFVQPLLPRAKAVFHDLTKVFSFSEQPDLSSLYNNKLMAVIQLGDVNEACREILPSLLVELLLQRAVDQKGDGTPKEITTVVIDEAHNLLGYENTQTDSIHGNTVHVFEKAIKEGRKFAFFLCLASQRPSDISSTITSQLHNFFIHKLVNPSDIERIRKTVSFMGEGSLSMLSVLGQGECIVSGPSLYMPQFVCVDQLDKKFRPNSSDIQLFGDNGILSSN